MRQKSLLLERYTVNRTATETRKSVYDASITSKGPTYNTGGGRGMFEPAPTIRVSGTFRKNDRLKSSPMDW